MAKLADNRLWQFLDPNGVPYAGAQLFTYTAGTSTKEPTYQDSASSTAHSNPIVLDAAGKIPAALWLSEGTSYKFVLAPSDDTDPPASPIETIDDVSGINDFSIGGLDQWIVSELTPTFVSSSSFTVTGDNTSTFHVGRRVKVTDAGGTKYATITATAFTTLTTVTVSVDAGGSLQTPTSAVSYGVMTSADSAIPARRDTVPAFSNNTDPTKMMKVNVANVPAGTIVTHTTGGGGLMPPGVIAPFAGATIPSGWLECDGSAVSRTTYAALHTALKDVGGADAYGWGDGDGSTTFNLPDLKGKVAIGAGTGSIVESFTDAEITTGTDTVTVESNAAKWTTGMQVTFNTGGTPPTTNPANLLDDSDTVYIVRTGATSIKFATTLANAQNGTVIDITAAGSGTFTITYALPTFTLAQHGGEVAHAESSTENLLHTHTQNAHAHTQQIFDSSGGVSGGPNGSNGSSAANNTSVGNTNNATAVNQSTGGNAAGNIMQPYAVFTHIISY